MNLIRVTLLSDVATYAANAANAGIVIQCILHRIGCGLPQARYQVAVGV